MTWKLEFRKDVGICRAWVPNIIITVANHMRKTMKWKVGLPIEQLQGQNIGSYPGCYIRFSGLRLRA